MSEFAGTDEMSDWPQYACAILEDAAGRLLLEKRPPDARHAPGKLTCFGGRREEGETPEQCLRRELREELNWEPQTLTKRVELWVAGEPIAWFYHGEIAAELDPRRLPAGCSAVLVSQRELPEMPVSHWHALVLQAWSEGRDVVR